MAGVGIRFVQPESYRLVCIGTADSLRVNTLRRFGFRQRECRVKNRGTQEPFFQTGWENEPVTLGMARRAKTVDFYNFGKYNKLHGFRYPVVYWSVVRSSAHHHVDS